MMTRLVPSIFLWLTVVITLALAPTIETYNGYVTTNVTGATNASYMIGMTAIDDFGGLLMILGLLVSGGVFAVAGMKRKDASVRDMLEVVGAVIVSILALAFFSSSIIDNMDTLITAGSGVAKTIYGALVTLIYVVIISGPTAYIGHKALGGKKSKKSKEKSSSGVY